jgi:hypothetical protein
MAYGMNWLWVWVAVVVPGVLGLLITLACFAFRPKVDSTIAAVLGSAAVFALCIGLIGREYTDIERLSQACFAAEIACTIYPESGIRYGIYMGIALVQVFVLFMLSLWMEERNRRGEFAGSWR